MEARVLKYPDLFNIVIFKVHADLVKMNDFVIPYFQNRWDIYLLKESLKLVFRKYHSNLNDFALKQR